MRHTFVIHEGELEPTRREGDTASEKIVLGTHTGSQHLEQRLVRYATGRSLPRGDENRDELLYVISGRGTLELDGDPHPLEPDSGVYVRAGESYVVANDGADELVLVSTSVPVEHVNRPPRQVVVRFADRPELRADAKRTFRYLVNQDAGCLDATQFVGIVEPCRAPDHSHSYDELGYIVEGEGFAHIEGESIPLRAGSSFHLPPEQVHCIENTGPGTMRILGVFHPSGDPASRAYEDTSERTPA
jgi:quercetin dioxygenase-like cupin family protein